MNPEFKKSPGLAGFLSCLPGLGQAYVGYYTQGFIYILIFATGIWATDHVGDMESLIGPFLAFFWIFNIIDAVRKAKLYNLHQMGTKEAQVPTDSPLVGGVILLVLGAILTLRVTLDIDMDWLEDLWPIAILVGGAYMILKYRRQKETLRGGVGGPPYSPTPPPPAYSGDPTLRDPAPPAFGDEPPKSEQKV